MTSRLKELIDMLYDEDSHQSLYQYIMQQYFNTSFTEEIKQRLISDIRSLYRDPCEKSEEESEYEHEDSEIGPDGLSLRIINNVETADVHDIPRDDTQNDDYIVCHLNGGDVDYQPCNIHSTTTPEHLAKTHALVYYKMSFNGTTLESNVPIIESGICDGDIIDINVHIDIDKTLTYTKWSDYYITSHSLQFNLKINNERVSYNYSGTVYNSDYDHDDNGVYRMMTDSRDVVITDQRNISTSELSFLDQSCNILDTTLIIKMLNDDAFTAIAVIVNMCDIDLLKFARRYAKNSYSYWRTLDIECLKSAIIDRELLIEILDDIEDLESLYSSPALKRTIYHLLYNLAPDTLSNYVDIDDAYTMLKYKSTDDGFCDIFDINRYDSAAFIKTVVAKCM